MKLETIKRKIRDRKNSNRIYSEYRITDDSIQAELRLSVQYSINYQVDAIHYPKNLDRSDRNNPLWERMRELENKIKESAKFTSRCEQFIVRASSKSAKGQRIRERAETEFRRLHGEEFLEMYRQANLKSNVSRVKKEIEQLQREQMQIIPEMRAHNSAYLSDRKQVKAQQREADQQALTSGEFWKANKEAIKDYFSPPFTRNYLCDVSERWRAALYSEVQSTGWKAGKGDWRHKLIGTGRCYLCGIDDNGDEWGHRVDLQPATDHYGDPMYSEYSVEEAMATLFGVDQIKLCYCERQGDLLFCSESTGDKINNLQEQSEPWEIRESHIVESDGLMRNGRYFFSPNPITITHTSHQTVVLEPGEYRLYELQINAD